MNNWSTKGNVNPYTGEKGYVDPFNQPSTPRNSYNPYGGGTRQKNSW
jgi:hypothetical protein